jgi:hypothetical protein
MEALSGIDSPELVEAVRIWTGWGVQTWPSRDEARVRAQLGDAVASKLLPVIKSLEDDFYSSDANLTAANLQEMGKLASSDFRQKRPGVADEIVEAFAWCYTFDFK